MAKMKKNVTPAVDFSRTRETKAKRIGSPARIFPFDGRSPPLTKDPS